MGRGDDLLLAFVRACGDEPRSPIERVPECFEPRASTGGGGASIFRLPTAVTERAPSSSKRRASVSFCASTSAKRSNSGRSSPLARRHRLKLRNDMRPFTSANGTPASAVSRIRFGQISDSVNTARSGRQ